MSGWFLLLLILDCVWMLYLALIVNRIVSWNSCNCASTASEMKFLLCWEIWSWISDIVLYNEIYCELLTFCMAVIIEKTAVLTQQHSWKWVIRMFMLLTGNDVDIIRTAACRTSHVRIYMSVDVFCREKTSFINELVHELRRIKIGACPPLTWLANCSQQLTQTVRRLMHWWPVTSLVMTKSSVESLRIDRPWRLCSSLWSIVDWRCDV